MADRPLSAIFAVGNYEGAFRRAIVSYKYGRDFAGLPCSAGSSMGSCNGMQPGSKSTG